MPPFTGTNRVPRRAGARHGAGSPAPGVGGMSAVMTHGAAVRVSGGSKGELYISWLEIYTILYIFSENIYSSRLVQVSGIFPALYTKDSSARRGQGQRPGTCFLRGHARPGVRPGKSVSSRTLTSRSVNTPISAVSGQTRVWTHDGTRASAKPSDVEVAHLQCIGLDKTAALLNAVAHQDVEHLVRGLKVLDPDLDQPAGFGVHCRLP